MKIKLKSILLMSTLLVLGCGGGSDSKDTSTSDDSASVSTTRSHSDILVVDNIAWQDSDDIKGNLVKYGYYQEYCEDLVLQEFDDWRLPSISEFSKSLEVKDQFNFLFDDENYRYWTSAKSTDSQGTKVWIYNLFGEGAYSIKESTIFALEGTELDTGYNVRCVRDIN